MIHYKKTALLLSLLGTFQVDAAASSKAIKVGVGVAGVVLLGGKAAIDCIRVTNMLKQPERKLALRKLNEPDCTLSFRIGRFYDYGTGDEDRIYRGMSTQQAYQTVCASSRINGDIEEVSGLRICSSGACLEMGYAGERYQFREFLALSKNSGAPMSLSRAIATYRLENEAE